MSKLTKKLLALAGALVVIGGVIFALSMSRLGWDFTKLSTEEYVENVYTIDEAFSSVSIDSDTAKIVFVPSDGESSVVCYERKNGFHSVKVINGKLIIEAEDTRKWYEYIGIGFGSPTVTVSIPTGEYGELSIETDTSDIKIPKEFKFKSIDISSDTGDISNYASALGRIEIETDTGKIVSEGVSCSSAEFSVSTGRINITDLKCEGEFEIEVSTGKAFLTDVYCKNLNSEGNTGDISLEKVIVSEKIFIERSTGNIVFDGVDASEIFIETSTGDVTGTLLSEKVFIVRSNTGKISVPDTVTGGRCQITTNTGDIKISLSH